MTQIEVPAKSGLTYAEVRPLLGSSWIIEGEDPQTYERLLAQVGTNIGPRDVIDWLLVFEIVVLTWEIRRARQLSGSVLRLRRCHALGNILRQISPQPDFLPLGDPSTDLVARWREGQKGAVAEVKSLLSKAGFSLADVDAQTLSENAEEFDRIDARSERCETRRHKLLQEIERRRFGAAKPVIDASNEAIEAEFETLPPRAVSERIES